MMESSALVLLSAAQQVTMIMSAMKFPKELPLSIWETGVPCGFGVLTTENIEQAVERAGTKAGNKGSDTAASMIEMINLMRQL